MSMRFMPASIARYISDTQSSQLEVPREPIIIVSRLDRLTCTRVALSGCMLSSQVVASLQVVSKVLLAGRHPVCLGYCGKKSGLDALSDSFDLLTALTPLPGACVQTLSSIASGTSPPPTPCSQMSEWTYPKRESPIR